MVVGDNDQFIKKYALEFAEICQEFHHHPYAYIHEKTHQKDEQLLRYGQNNLCHVYFGNPIETQNFPVVFQDNEENGW